MRPNRPSADRLINEITGCSLTLIRKALFPAIVRFLWPEAVLIQGTSTFETPSKPNPAKPANDWLMSL
jgi:hypothetical protein